MPKTNYYSFGLGATRDNFANVYNPANQSPRAIDAKNSPGPGEYKYKNKGIGSEGRRFSFLSRTKNVYEPMNMAIKAASPGPGTYVPVIQINKIGKYVLSTTPNSKASAWSPSRQRFVESNT